METLESAIAELRGILDDHPLSKLPEPEMAMPDSPGHWSRKQILGHLIDSAANNHHRFVRAQIESELAMPGYRQVEWVAAGRYQDRAWGDLVEFWTAYNRQLLHIMEATPRERLSAPCRIGENPPVTLEFLMVDYVHHMKNHLRQIARGFF